MEPTQTLPQVSRLLLKGDVMLPPGNTVFNQYRESGEEDQCFLITEKIVLLTVTQGALLSLHQIDIVISCTQNIL